MSLVSFATYNYFFWTNRYNNSFDITLGGIKYLCFLPIGFYTADENMTHFASILNNSYVDPYGVTQHNPWGYSLGVTVTKNTITNQYLISTTIPFVLSFKGRDPTYAKLNSALLLGFNTGGNYPFNTSVSTSVTVPYSFDFVQDVPLTTPAPPIVGKLQNLVLQMNVPPQNLAFDTETGYMDYTYSFAYIPVGEYAPYDPINYLPQDTGTWTWQSPSTGSKLGTIRYMLLTPAYQEMPMVSDYTMAIRVDILVDDVVEQMKIMRETIKLQKLLLIGQSHQMESAEPTEPQEETPQEDQPQQEQGQRETEDQLHEGPLDYYGNNLYYD